MLESVEAPLRKIIRRGLTRRSCISEYLRSDREVSIHGPTHSWVQRNVSRIVWDVLLECGHHAELPRKRGCEQKRMRCHACTRTPDSNGAPSRSCESEQPTGRHPGKKES